MIRYKQKDDMQLERMLKTKSSSDKFKKAKLQNMRLWTMHDEYAGETKVFVPASARAGIIE